MRPRTVWPLQRPPKRRWNVCARLEARGFTAMKPIARADSRPFMASPDGCLLSELSSRYGSIEKSSISSPAPQLCTDTIRLLRTHRQGGTRHERELEDLC